MLSHGPPLWQSTQQPGSLCPHLQVRIWPYDPAHSRPEEEEGTDFARHFSWNKPKLLLQNSRGGQVSLSSSCWSFRELQEAHCFTTTCCTDPVLRDISHRPQAPTVALISITIFQTAIPRLHWTGIDVLSPQRKHQHQLQAAENKDDFSHVKICGVHN